MNLVIWNMSLKWSEHPNSEHLSTLPTVWFEIRVNNYKKLEYNAY